MINHIQNILFIYIMLYYVIHMLYMYVYIYIKLYDYKYKHLHTCKYVLNIYCICVSLYTQNKYTQ